MGQSKEIKQNLIGSRNFEYFLAATTKVLLLEGKLGTRFHLQPTLTFS